eukprot:CAMPEP_0116033022 /NCGR_PEP_ID=MMETSP0321-20121206/18666_1 /TAXON_ID=163516 /ORGANISM="Leptocylindrus danicus var. danicus, Strain B650" /LENGTH=131 /DNA_ID=CAMNT_0003508867 /DNA_START=62 /DNA_END=457 /DNA_ORIENTATION=+
MKLTSIIALALSAVGTEAFSVVGRKTTGSCRTFLAAGNDNEPEKKSIGLSGLFQLITAGMGSPFLGDFEGVDEETGKFMFSLEANNLVDENGESRQTKAAYFESGWVSEEDMEKERKKKESGGGFKFPWDK